MVDGCGRTPSLCVDRWLLCFSTDILDVSDDCICMSIIIVFFGILFVAILFEPWLEPLFS